jgi:hypothetical protein
LEKLIASTPDDGGRDKDVLSHILDSVTSANPSTMRSIEVDQFAKITLPETTDPQTTELFKTFSEKLQHEFTTRAEIENTAFWTRFRETLDKSLASTDPGQLTATKENLTQWRTQFLTRGAVDISNPQHHERRNSLESLITLHNHLTRLQPLRDSKNWPTLAAEINTANSIIKSLPESSEEKALAWVNSQLAHAGFPSIQAATTTLLPALYQELLDDTKQDSIPTLIQQIDSHQQLYSALNHRHELTPVVANLKQLDEIARAIGNSVTAIRKGGLIPLPIASWLGKNPYGKSQPPITGDELIRKISAYQVKTTTPDGTTTTVPLHIPIANAAALVTSLDQLPQHLPTLERAIQHAGPENHGGSSRDPLGELRTLAKIQQLLASPDEGVITHIHLSTLALPPHTTSSLPQPAPLAQLLTRLKNEGNHLLIRRLLPELDLPPQADPRPALRSRFQKSNTDRNIPDLILLHRLMFQIDPLEPLLTASEYLTLRCYLKGIHYQKILKDNRAAVISYQHAASSATPASKLIPHQDLRDRLQNLRKSDRAAYDLGTQQALTLPATATATDPNPEFRLPALP